MSFWDPSNSYPRFQRLLRRYELPAIGSAYISRLCSFEQTSNWRRCNLLLTDIQDAKEPWRLQLTRVVLAPLAAQQHTVCATSFWKFATHKS